LININESTGIEQTALQASQRYNVFTVDGVKVLTNAKDLRTLSPGIYVINGQKKVID
jgi:hypothetical protein